MPLTARSQLLALAASLWAPVAAGAEEAHLHACDLLSAGEVAAVVGFNVTRGRTAQEVNEAGRRSSTCSWVAPLAQGEAPDPRQPIGGVSFAILNVMVWPEGPEGAKKYLQDFRDAAESHAISRAPTPVTIGDEGLIWGSGVAVRKKAVSFGISVHLTSGDTRAHRGMEQELAHKIAARL